MVEVTLSLNDEDAARLIKHVKATGSVSLSQIVTMPDGIGSLVYYTLKGVEHVGTTYNAS